MKYFLKKNGEIANFFFQKGETDTQLAGDSKSAIRRPRYNLYIARVLYPAKPSKPRTDNARDKVVA